jgi:uncharacterized damage-inducible protein DinB
MNPEPNPSGPTTLVRTDPPLAGDEVATLRAFLDYHRDTLRLKTAGLDHDQLNRALAPSTMTLAGLLKHLAVVESSWFAEYVAGQEMMPPFDTAPWDDDRDWEWHTAPDDSPEELRRLFDEAVARSDEITEAALARAGLDTLTVKADRSGERFSLRWILTHMLEEYARHNGHADLIRESIDGATGE